MGLEQVVNVVISRETQAVSQEGFGTGLMLGTNAAGLFGGDTVRSYSGTAGMTTDGFTSGMDEFKAATKYFGQTPKPTTLKIGKARAKVAQIDTITPSAVNSHHYILNLAGRLNGINFNLAYEYDADGSATATEIVTGLTTVINADSANNGVTASGSTTLILTANVAGQPFTTNTNADSDMTLVHTTASIGVADSLAAIALVDNDWYAFMSSFRSIDDIMNQADYIEANQKLAGFSRSDSGMAVVSSTTDLLYLMKQANYFRSWAEYSSDAANFIEAGWFGRVLPLTPGTETWAYKTIAGAVVDTLTTTQIQAIEAKNGNYYYSLGGKNITRTGKVAGGEWIDIIRLIDLIAVRQQEGIFGQLTRLDKIPFTNGGITVIENECAAVLKANQKLGGVAPDDVDDNGDLVPGYSTDFPRVSDISSNNRANRILSGGTWQARMAGAIHAANINGTVTV